MNFFDYKAVKVWFDVDKIWVQLDDGQISNLPFVSFERLAKASPEQLKQFEIINGYAIHWPGLDEDLSVAGFFETIKTPGESKSFA